MARPRKARRWFFEHGVSLIGALLIVFTIRSSFFESFKIPSGSMIPTILIGDHVLVNKFSYGMNLPFSEYFGEPIKIWKSDGPQRGEVVVFKYPRDESVNYIKRVIGVPGDQIVIRDRTLYVNDRRIALSPAEEKAAREVFASLDDPKLSEEDLSLFVEDLEGTKHFVLKDRNNFLTENFGPVLVPDGKYFVMGDNRDFSNDSRFWGFVSERQLRGRALFVWLSVWIAFDPFEFTFHPERFGKSI